MCIVFNSKNPEIMDLKDTTKKELNLLLDHIDEFLTDDQTKKRLYIDCQVFQRQIRKEIETEKILKLEEEIEKGDLSEQLIRYKKINIQTSKQVIQAIDHFIEMIKSEYYN